MRRRRAAAWLVAGTLAWWIVPAALVANSHDERFLDGLRHRRLFELAEKYAERRLADPQLTIADRGSMTLDLLRSYAEHAANSPVVSRSALWLRADGTTDQFLRAFPQHPQILLIRTQQAVSILARGELARLESEINPDTATGLEQARDWLRSAGRLLETLESDLAAAMARPKHVRPAADELAPEELTSLLHNVRYQRARAARNQALCYAEGSPDRVAALTSAVSTLDVPLREIDPLEPLAATLRLELAVCQRLLRDDEAARQILEALDVAAVSAELRLAARAELVRLHLAAQRRSEALRMLTPRILPPGSADEAVLSPEFDFAHLETYVALWQAAAESKNTAETEKWQNQSIAAVKHVEQTHGPYWGRRAEILLLRVGGQRNAGSLEILRRAADNFYLKGQVDEALATYDQAAAAARETRNMQVAFEMAYKAALVEQQRQRPLEAARRFRELSLARKEHPQAANAHLLAVVNEAQAWQADAALRDLYLTRLTEHIAEWPASATANSARLWLGDVYEREKSWQQALSAYRNVERDSEPSLEAVRGADRCWRVWLSQRSSAGENVEPVAEEAARWLESGFLAADERLPAAWADSQRERVLVAARLRLAWTKAAGTAMEERLRMAMQGPPAPDPNWMLAAQSVSIAALASQPNRLAEARQRLAQLPTATIEPLLDLVRLLESLRSRAANQERTELAKLQLLAIDSLFSDLSKLAASTRDELLRCRARALTASGDLRGGLQILAELAKGRPLDAELQVEYGELLLTSRERSDWLVALDHWRLVAGRSRPRSERWFKAKYFVAKSQFLLGDPSAAAKLIQYLLASEELARSGFEREFLELLRQCQKK